MTGYVVVTGPRVRSGPFATLVEANTAGQASQEFTWHVRWLDEEGQLLDQVPCQ